MSNATVNRAAPAEPRPLGSLNGPEGFRLKSIAARRPRRLTVTVILAVIAATLLAAGDRTAVRAAETAASADAFVDSIGVNTHFSYTRTAYSKRYETIRTLLLGLGVRHIRDGAAPRGIPEFDARLNELGRDGIHANFIFAPTQTAQYITEFAARMPNSLESFEGPNEPNLSKDPNWIASTRAFQQLLYTTVKASSGTARFPVIGPSVTNKQSDDSIGDLSAYMDYGNLHNYFGGRPPGTPGWGPNGYGSIEYGKRIMAAVRGAKPVITTETGYCNNDLPQGVPLDIAAIYEPRIFLEQYNHGIKRTYQYEFVDDGTPAEFFSTCGLVTADLAPKPAYAALKSLIGVLSDPGPKFTAGSLDYTLSAPANVHHALFEKRNGAFYLALWVEEPAFEPNAHRKMPVASETVALTFPRAVASATKSVFNANGELVASPIAVGTGTTTLSVNDYVTILEVLPP
jgi:hypothetical protein